MNECIELRHFRYLLAIVKCKGFRAASVVLNTTQPNLSIQAKQFQELLGIRLFRNGPDRRIRLTETGVAFGPIAQELLYALDQAIAALLAVERGEIRDLKFGCASFIDEALFHAACDVHKEMVPNCAIRPAHGDTAQLVEEIVFGEIDAGIVMLPVADPRLCVEEIRRERLVACLRIDHPLAAKSVLQPADLQANLSILQHPQRHPGAHARLNELLAEVGVQLGDYSRVSHPVEIQQLVKNGYGCALIREGTLLDSELTTRAIAGVNWTVDTAFVYNKLHHPKTIPVLLRRLKRRLKAALPEGVTFNSRAMSEASKDAHR